MPSHIVQKSAKPGHVQITDVRTGLHQLVFIGDAAARFEHANEITPQREAPSQKWCSVIAA